MTNQHQSYTRLIVEARPERSRTSYDVIVTAPVNAVYHVTYKPPRDNFTPEVATCDCNGPPVVLDILWYCPHIYAVIEHRRRAEG
jgi:hypothetical protein